MSIPEIAHSSLCSYPSHYSHYSLKNYRFIHNICFFLQYAVNLHTLWYNSNKKA